MVGRRAALAVKRAGVIPGPCHLSVSAFKQQVAHLKQVLHGVAGGQVLVGAQKLAGGQQRGAKSLLIQENGDGERMRELGT